jgi:hypothetical protein
LFIEKYNFLCEKRLVFGKQTALFLFLVKFDQLFKMLLQKCKKILKKMLETAHLVKSSFLHIGNTKIEVEFFLPKPS